MQNLILSAAALNQTALDFEGNSSRVLKAIERAKKEGAHVLCLPELSVCGYGCEDEFFSIDLARRCELAVAKLVAATKGILTAFGAPIYVEGNLYNCAVVAKDEKIIGITAKKFLAREGIHYEPRWFTPWQRGEQTKVSYAGFENIDFGDLYFKVGNVGIGIEICEEAWGAESPNEGVAGSCEIVLNLSASHFSIGKNDIRRQLVGNLSRSLCVYYLYANLLGVDAGRAIYDGGCLVGFNGNVINESSRFSFENLNLITTRADLNLVKVSKIRQHSSYAYTPKGRNEGLPLQIKTDAFSIGSAKLTAPVIKDLKNYTAEEEFHLALTLGLFDYMRKTYAKGFIVSLSGGCDSSACAYLIASMVYRAIDQLGVKKFCERVGQRDLEKKSAKDIVRNLLTCIYQASDNSGPVTEEAAEKLAKELGAEYHRTSISSAVETFVKQAEECLDRPLDWKVDDLALQNIQARVRSPLPWMLANIKNQILVTTSNRSEVSVGYATMDGDSSGGLAPLSGVDKSFLRKWLVWAEKTNDGGIGKVESLKLVNNQQPTAELRPQGMKQTDEADLMPYEILNKIASYMVRDKMGLEEIEEFLSKDFTYLDQATISEYVKKFRRMWRNSQWKRERFAPGFHVDSYNLDPQSWCRFPIISGS